MTSDFSRLASLASLASFTLDRRAFTRAALAAPAALLLPGPAAAAAPGDAVLTLPAPRGPYPVGCRSVYLADPSRPDPLSPELPVRELMLTFLYPAAPSSAARAPQLPPGAADCFGLVVPNTPLGLPSAGVDWRATLTHSRPDAPVRRGRPGRWPVLVHSPGGGDPRGLGTCLAEELASHGAVVVLVDHPGDAFAVEFPGTTAFRDDPVRATVLRGDPRDEPPLWRTLLETRVADLHFVLDRLHHAADLPLPPGLAAALDLGRLAVYGHSLGASAATEVFHEDRRVRAAVNLEGYLDHPPTAPGADPEPLRITAQGTDRPLLLLGSELFPHREELDRSWSALAARSPGPVRRVRVPAVNHWAFTDYAAMVPQLQSAGLLTPAHRDTLVGPLPPTTALPLLHTTVRHFLTHHLTPSP
ncbi:alpha/beta hydrolase [Kitasatospora sp. NPDC004799]|uniref:alpha/beta hydrolase n=1 Tax=Kitasatospora sp. NPDC004799 TaxID=3154460 RepID=UPI0033B78B15